MQDIRFFDLETKYLFKEIRKDWENLTWSQKEELRKEIIPKLKMGLAGIMDMEGKVIFFTEKEIKKLVNELLSAHTIVGHNLIRFDYDIISSYCSIKEMEEIKNKTIDTLKRLEMLTGRLLGLDHLGEINFDMKKTMNTIEIPKLIREGKIDVVKSYLKQDLLITKKLYLHGQKMPIKYLNIDKVTGKKEIREIIPRW